MVVMKTATVAEAYLELLALRGIEYFFGNAGTDFASIIDAFACRQEHGKSIPRAVHPEGWAVRTNQFPLSELPLTAHYEKICEAFGGYGERVEDP